MFNPICLEGAQCAHRNFNLKQNGKRITFFFAVWVRIPKINEILCINCRYLGSNIIYCTMSMCCIITKCHASTVGTLEAITHRTMSMCCILN